MAIIQDLPAVWLVCYAADSDIIGFPNIGQPPKVRF